LLSDIRAANDRSAGLGNTLKAVVFGLGMGVISALIMVPLVFFPQLHPGFFSLNLGIKVVLAIFLWHLIYGLHLGAIYNPLPQPDAACERATVWNIHERDGLDVVTGGETVASLSGRHGEPFARRYAARVFRVALRARWAPPRADGPAAPRRGPGRPPAFSGAVAVRPP
jgi:hypothetical protein